jgi:hypothetical protein
VAMGCFGELLLVNGETDLSLDAQLGEVVRLYLTNTANTRTFKVALPGARMKLVGGDSGHVEHEEFVDEVILVPSERVVVDILIDEAATSRSSTERLSAFTRWQLSTSGRIARGVVRGAVRDPAHERRHGCGAGAGCSLPRRRAGQDRGIHRGDGNGGAGGSGGPWVRTPLPPFKQIVEARKDFDDSRQRYGQRALNLCGDCAYPSAS